MATKIYLGQTVRGTINLREYDRINNVVNPYVIQNNALIHLNFPGSSGTPGVQGTSVVLSSAPSGQIFVDSYTASQLSFVMPPSLSSGLFITTTAAVDCFITNPDSSVDIFESVFVYNILATKN